MVNLVKKGILHFVITTGAQQEGGGGGGGGVGKLENWKKCPDFRKKAP